VGVTILDTYLKKSYLFYPSKSYNPLPEVKFSVLGLITCGNRAAIFGSLIT
jgi:hypothetical protein